MLSVMLRCRRCCVLVPADLLGVTSMLDCELRGCLFLLESDQRAFPGTVRHSPHTNGSKFKLKRAKNASNSVVFCWILEEIRVRPTSPIIRDVPRYFSRGFDLCLSDVLVRGRSSARRARAVGHSCALLTERMARRAIAADDFHSSPPFELAAPSKARLCAERCPLPLVPQATVEVDDDGVLCPLDASCDIDLRLTSLRA
jgi:hypothetical protein